MWVGEIPGFVIWSQNNFEKAMWFGCELSICNPTMYGGIISKNREELMTLCKEIIIFHLKCCVQFWPSVSRETCSKLNGCKEDAMTEDMARPCCERI